MGATRSIVHVGSRSFRRISALPAAAAVHDDIAELVRLGRMTTLQKPNGVVRGITNNFQQFSPVVERATVPFHYALSTKSGGECIVHALQALTDLDERATVLSIDGIGAFDLIPGGDSALPFVYVMLSLLLRERVRCTPFCVRLCGTTAGSRHKFGTLELPLVILTSCCVLQVGGPTCQTLVLGFGHVPTYPSCTRHIGRTFGQSCERCRGKILSHIATKRCRSGCERDKQVCKRLS